MTPEEWAKHPQALAMTEAQLQTGVQHLLTAFGWRWHHETDSRRSRAGFLDINAVRVRDARVLYAENKTQRGRVRPEQAEWFADLQAIAEQSQAVAALVTAPTVEVYLWRPSDFLSGTIERCLR